jgi:hypothetical protein
MISMAWPERGSEADRSQGDEIRSVGTGRRAPDRAPNGGLLSQSAERPPSAACAAVYVVVVGEATTAFVSWMEMRTRLSFPQTRQPRLIPDRILSGHKYRRSSDGWRQWKRRPGTIWQTMTTSRLTAIEPRRCFRRSPSRRSRRLHSTLSTAACFFSSQTAAATYARSRLPSIPTMTNGSV